MKRLLPLILLLCSLLILSSCAKDPYTFKVVKPKSHFLPYNSKKHKKRKRTKVVKMKSHKPKNPLFKPKEEKNAN